MKDTLSKLLIFAVGAGIGSAVTWKFVKTKYERLAQEEIDEVKAYYRDRDGDTEAVDESESVAVAKVDDNSLAYHYVDLIHSEGYSEATESGKEVADMDGPYVISADEFGDSYDHETDSLIYYADGILATETDEVIDDIDHIIGVKNLTRFDDDVMFIRNDSTMHDYEVAREERTFAEVVGFDPPEDV